MSSAAVATTMTSGSASATPSPGIGDDQYDDTFGFDDAFDAGFGPFMSNSSTYAPSPEELKANNDMFIGMAIGSIGLVLLVMIVVSMLGFKRVTGHWNVFKFTNWRERADKKKQSTQYNQDPAAFTAADGMEQRLMQGQAIQMDKEEKHVMSGASSVEPVFREALPDPDLPDYGGRLTLPPSYHRRASQEKRHSGGGWMRADVGEEPSRPFSPMGPAYVLGDEPLSPKSSRPEATALVTSHVV